LQEAIHRINQKKNKYKNKVTDTGDGRGELGGG
jgi:hypothetical protein